MERDVTVPQLIKALATRIGVPSFVGVCTDLLTGADRNGYVDELRNLTGHAWRPGDNVFDSDSWPDYWVRTWGARGLLHVWHEDATEAILTGLADEHWRPAEMCLKVTARHEVAGTGDAAAALLKHDVPRVQVQALRALAVVGDTPHVEAVLRMEETGIPELQSQAARTLEQMRVRSDV